MNYSEQQIHPARPGIALFLFHFVACGPAADDRHYASQAFTELI